MEYLFITKQTEDNVIINELIREIFKNISAKVTEEYIYIAEDEMEIQYKIEKKKVNSRCHLELKATARLDKDTKALSMVDREIMTSNKQKYFTCIRVYDGVSESYCERLYPKYSKFERKIRQLVLLVLTKAFGASWDKETISKEDMNSLKGIARKKIVDENSKEKNIPISEILEQMDLYTLEKYLFERREVEYKEFLEVHLSKDRLSQMEKNDICRILDKMRPRSLWERHFERFGKQDDWERIINSIHGVRNCVAHNKTISSEEYDFTTKQLNIINKKLEQTIEKIEDQEFNDTTIVDIVGSFAVLAKDFSDIIKKYDIDAMAQGLLKAVQNIISPMSFKFPKQQEIIEQNFRRIGIELAKPFTAVEALTDPNISLDVSEALHTACLVEKAFSIDEE